MFAVGLAAIYWERLHQIELLERRRNDLAEQQVQVHVQPQEQRPPLIEDFPEHDLEDFAKRLRCTICMIRAVNIRIKPCGHLLCSTCFNRLEEPKFCPICRASPIKAKVIFYGGYKQKYLKYKNKYLKLKNYKLL